VVTAGFMKQDFLDLIDGVERHLAMAFHRYLEGLRLSINGTPVRPWDPFLLHHPTTWSSPVERLGPSPHTVEVQCHVLPHKDHLDPDIVAAAAGPDGWTAQQGFYVYRNARLLVAGSWLGLGQGAHGPKRRLIALPEFGSTFRTASIGIGKSTSANP
jgi:hypothetical protein